MPSITAVSGQPTKNLGATIVNAGNTPASNDATNNNAGLGILTGSNSGKGSGSKVVERDGSPSHPSSGISISTPGVQAATNARQFASPTSRAIAPGAPGPDGSIQRFNVSWKNIFRQYPTTESPNRNHTLKREYSGSYNAAAIGGATEDVYSVMRDERAEFGTSVQLAKNSAGIMFSVGSPSGTAERSARLTDGGYVDSFLFGLNKAPEFPEEEGTIDEEGFSSINDEECRYSPGMKPYHCPGWLNGFGRIGTRIFQNNQSERALALDDKRHTVVVASGAGVGHCIAYNTDASRMAVGMPYANDETGEVRVYEFIPKTASSGSPNVGRGIWARCGGLITGNQKGDRFGYSVAIDGAGDTLFVGAPRPKGSGYVSIQQYASNAWSGETMSSGVAPRDRYGYSVSCNEAGNAYAVGAPWGSGTRGYAQFFANFSSGGSNWLTTRRGKYFTFAQSQQAEQDNGKVKVQRIVGTASGERLGWSVDMMYKSIPSTRAGRYNLRVVVGSPYYSRSVSEYDFGKRTFAERAAGVPIKDIGISESGEKPWYSQDYLENGIAYNKVGLSSEGKVQVWGYSGAEMTQSTKFAAPEFEYIHFGKSSSKTIMIGTQGSELGYSVKTSDDGDFLAAGAPGTPAEYFDPTDCDAIEELDSSVAAPESGEAPPTTPIECGIALPEVHPKDPNIGTGAVRCYRYMWKGAEGDVARKQHFRSESDYFIKFGNTLRGVVNHFPYQYMKERLSVEYFVRDHRYVRPSWQDSGRLEYPRCQPGERFGTSVALFAEFAVGNVMFPQLGVGAPYAMDINYMNDSVKMHDGLNNFDPIPFGNADIKGSETRTRSRYVKYDANFYMYRTGRADMFVGFPKLDGNLNMPAGAGRNKPGSKTITSRRTKPKFEYLEDGRKIIASGANDGGGRESYFIAPNVSGSGLANDNALKSSRKTFGTGGVNFTSSD